MNSNKIRQNLGWRPKRTFGDGLAETVSWYRENHAWTAAVRSGAYRDFYDKQYAERLAAGEKR
jgi:dTDP-glucose 4,6-dehydratase